MHVPTTSDWHARLCLVTVSAFKFKACTCVMYLIPYTVMHNRLYSSSFPSDKATLFHLKQAINRTSYGKNPKNNMKTTEDFLETVLYAHIVAAAKQVIKTTGEVSDCSVLAKGVVEQFIKVSLQCFCDDDDDEPLP